MATPVLSVDNLSVTFRTKTGRSHPVNNVSFDLAEGEILGIVGESGSGKSVTCLALAGLLGPTASATGFISFEDAMYDAAELGAMARSKLPSIGLIFQEPVSCLDPVRTIGSQIAEAAMSAGMSASEAKAEALRLLAEVAIPLPETRYNAYPAQFSGGMCQRVMIATALAMQPRLIIADEPTTALDVTVQAQVVALLVKAVRERGIPMIFISHDLDLVSEVCDRIAVMYAGSLVELNTTDNIYDNPRHPYTRLLLEAMPGRGTPLEKLADIPGELKLHDAMPSACAFAPRCPRVEAHCATAVPPLIAGAASLACFNPWSAHDV
ncbi:ABC transporter ATP-binding protein [Rhizobium rhizogenes]|uniref:ABC transporter ATP-binding protein n=1 Tax=Rhizobium rhizogenes TaxID=359 RepID=UPI00056A3A1A|nr:ABC transporter ATP-binding protein [Rhizobium rhizogenes]NTF84569.1 ABC transporter ATP-binding protein [Rhizobium rhizogenes]NTI25728.1 ABC transporter ATP-binding protein [Rhizobium rhizogenes]QTG09442.1 ABC transporter ATP-binding protein [Rhizobium rhizogenes]